MTPPRRQPPNAILAALLPILLVGGIWLGGHPEDLPGFARSALVSGRSTEVVDEAIERIVSDYYRPISPSSLSNASIAGAVASLGDRFSHYLTPREFREFNAPPSFTGIGVSVNPERRGLSIARVFDSSPAARAGLQPGDLIVVVNGRKLEGLSAEAATALIRGLPGTDVELAIEAQRVPPAKRGVTRTLRIARATISEPVVASETETVHGVKLGVVALAAFSPGAHGEVREAVDRELHIGARGLVLDLRGNGGGLVEEAQLIASIFIPKGTIVSTRGRTQPSDTLVATGGAISSSIPVVVLVDANTASASEIVTAALQDHHRATVVGAHTFGKGVFQEEQPLSNGGALDITVGEYFTPDGRNLGGGGVKEGAGITPEVLVRDGVDTPHGLNVALDTLAAKLK
ncbi:MAG: S41 family peptidase [Solirubrobacteraceae bacterium]|jgi:carboxyl-terminal processing protease